MATKFGFANREAFQQYLDAAMEQHKRFQHDLELQWLNEIIDEVQALPKRKPRCGDLFSLLPDALHREEEKELVN
jgi:hypothetical protein